jgi:hypothetical protein
MRVAVRRQITTHPFNRCGCAVVDALGLLRESILAEARYEGDWDIARALAEKVPDALLHVDAECNTQTLSFNQEIQQAIRRKDLRALAEAVAGVDLEICGQSVGPRGVEITAEALREAAEAQVAREKEEAALR